MLTTQIFPGRLVGAVVPVVIAFSRFDINCAYGCNLDVNLDDGRGHLQGGEISVPVRA